MQVAHRADGRHPGRRRSPRRSGNGRCSVRGSREWRRWAPTVVVGEAVAGVDFQADATRHKRRLRGFSSSSFSRSAPRRHRIGAGVQLHHRRAERLGGIELRAVRLDEQRDADARRRPGARRWARDGCAGPPRRCRLRWCAPRASPARCRRHAACASSAMASHLVGRRHFQIERNGQRLRTGASMSSSEIWRRSSRRCAVMPSAPGALRQHRGAHRIGIVAAARIAHGGDVIDVDAEAERLLTPPVKPASCSPASPPG